jgi:hypothetical protein
MSSKVRHTLPLGLVTLLVGLMLHSCQAFEEPPEGVLTPQELIFTSAAETMIANLTPDPTLPIPETPTASLSGGETDSPAQDDFQSPISTPHDSIFPSPTVIGQTPTATERLFPTSTPFPTAIPIGTPTSRPATALPSPSLIPQTPTVTQLLSPTNTPMETVTPIVTPRTPAATTSPPPSLIFEDDFTIRAGWHTEAREGFEMYYQAGGYRIDNLATNSNVSSTRSFDLQDMRVEVDATLVRGPLSGYYGVVCRFQNLQNLYAFVIGSDGFHAIVKIQDMEVSFLEEDRLESGPIHLGGGLNRITGICQGSQLSLEVNGQRLLETEDFTFGAGNVGLLVGNRDQPNNLVHFDNFALLAP